MSSLKLIIGNKKYSSWSMRPWLVLTHFGINFEERSRGYRRNRGNTPI